ncbi:SDR family oxidoreductase [Parasphingorhabdus flavimaris]|uniref:SDR family oxidoreductase n=1 Tax=Parasphingorhabdus flavimaris TaxID=266812 RepID=A0ABX2N488_9SPHN|nr:SDR family oxidoreductase [Parasphingorhabdus flavimaris]NVD28423.1 SDR family oxidoreductase [Parasphingorhabdus flavimaris]|tara:strand:- start:2176 stop:3006 length:831 start_codon:yes stop_codon:yes gene_type:complete
MGYQSGQKTIFITGGASGLGREVGRYFADKGWFVGIADVNEKGMAETATLLPEGQSSTHRLDVTDRAQWTKAVSEFAAITGGTMTVLFNNAGIGEGGAIQDMEDAAIDRMIAINLTGVISGTRACFDMLKNTPDSCVLYTASAAGIYGVADLSVYSATKFAVRGLAESHDIEFRKHDIKSRSLMPGFIDTNIISNVVEGTNQSGKERLEESGVMVSPVAIIGPAAWAAVHGDKVHTPVNKMAKQLAFAARWMPGRVRKQSVSLTSDLGEVLAGEEK